MPWLCSNIVTKQRKSKYEQSFNYHLSWGQKAASFSTTSAKTKVLQPGIAKTQHLALKCMQAVRKPPRAPRDSHSLCLKDLCDFMSLVMSKKNHGLHFGDASPSTLMLSPSLHLPAARHRWATGGQVAQEQLPFLPAYRPGSGLLPHVSSHLLIFLSLTNNQTFPSGSFFLCILAAAQKRLDYFIWAYF